VRVVNLPPNGCRFVVELAGASTVDEPPATVSGHGGGS
jgi:hypothetical protein